MQLSVAIVTVLYASITSALPTQTPRDLETQAASDLSERSNNGGWLFFAERPKAQDENELLQKRDEQDGIAPKVFIVSMFSPEETIWHGIPEFDLLAHNITLPGLSPLFPAVHCTATYAICQVVTGEGEINAASTIAALTLSPVFDLRHTYFLIAGIGGVNPAVATLGSVTLHRYEVQVALQYEFDQRDLPANFSTGYFAQGTTGPGQYPGQIYGTEVFELNAALRDEAVGLIERANVTLNDTTAAQRYRALYSAAPNDMYAAGTKAPSVVKCDGATSNVYFSGGILGQTFANYTRLMTNGSGVYCTTAQEDNATLEALLRADAANRTDFERIIVMRTASDFERPPPGVSAYDNLLYENPAPTPSLKNIYIAGLPIVQGIINGWDEKFAAGIKANNYVGDILGTLGGTPNFGTGPQQGDVVAKRNVKLGSMKRRGPI